MLVHDCMHNMLTVLLGKKENMEGTLRITEVEAREEFNKPDGSNNQTFHNCQKNYRMEVQSSNPHRSMLKVEECSKAKYQVL